MTQPHLEGLIPLYHAVNRLMLSLGVVGEVSSLDPAAIGVMDALRAIDGGRYDEALAALPDDLEECHRHSCKRKAALAALPGGGVDEAMVRRAVSAYNWKHYSGIEICCEESMRAALVEVLSPTPPPHEADRNE